MEAAEAAEVIEAIETVEAMPAELTGVGLTSDINDPVPLFSFFDNGVEAPPEAELLLLCLLFRLFSMLIA